MNKLRHKKLVDRLMDAYVTWREACLRVSDAYGSWAGERGVSATAAFGSYMAALDREEDAADAYACLVRRADQLLSSEHGPTEALGGPAWEVGRG
jgi:hypothetical protein